MGMATFFLTIWGQSRGAAEHKDQWYLYSRGFLGSKRAAKLYTAGMTKSVKKVETTIPPITVTAMGRNASAPAPSANASGERGL